MNLPGFGGDDEKTIFGNDCVASFDGRNHF
jgi:hypothetical protein